MSKMETMERKKPRPRGDGGASLGEAGRDRRRRASRPHHRGAGRAHQAPPGESFPAGRRGDPQACDSFLREGDPVKVHPFIEAENTAGHNVQRTCELLEVSRSAYYLRRNGAPCARSVTDATLTEQIKAIHDESKGTYGSPRVHQELGHRQVTCGRRRVTRLMRLAGLEGRCKKRWRKTTVADPEAEATKDLIQRQFGPCEEIDRRYVGDITYIATWEGWAYLSTVIDLASRKVVGWSLADHMRTELVEDALKMAFANRAPEEGVVFHGDRGCQLGFKESSTSPEPMASCSRSEGRASAGITPWPSPSSPPSSVSSSTLGHGRRGQDCAATVSYTHLTLPTKRIV